MTVDHTDPQDIDQLVDSIEAPGGERPMTGGETPAQAAPATQAPDPNAWRQGFDWKFKHGDKEVEPDSAEKARTWMSLGHNYSQRVQELNRRDTEMRQLAEKYKGYDRFAEVDKYARENPQWWKHVEESWGQRATQQAPSAADPALAPILERLQQTESVLQQWQQAKALEDQQKQDQALDAEISEIRKAHPNIDLKAVDPETGRSLEWKVLNHANQHGIQSFKAAFRDLFYDKLVEEAKAQGRVAIAKGQEQAAKKGLLGTTPAPTKGLQQAQNVRGKSYDNLVQEALSEFGIN